jgi:hypothetical protein
VPLLKRTMYDDDLFSNGGWLLNPFLCWLDSSKQAGAVEDFLFSMNTAFQDQCFPMMLQIMITSADSLYQSGHHVPASETIIVKAEGNLCPSMFS